MAIYLTGDKHGQTTELKRFAKRAELTTEDIIIILGDAGFNYIVDYDRKKKKYVNRGAEYIHKALKEIPAQILVVQGNHEAPAWYCDFCYETEAFGNRVWKTEWADNVIYLKNGLIYHIGSKDYLVMGGAWSIDHEYRQLHTTDEIPYYRGRFFPEEQMSDKEFEDAEAQMKEHNYKVDTVLAHTCPYSKQPTELFLKGIYIPIDNRMENKFEELSHKYHYDKWYFGHFHGDIEIDGTYTILFDDFIQVE